MAVNRGRNWPTIKEKNISRRATSPANTPQDLTPGLERLCNRDWVQAAPWQSGIQRIEARFSGIAYAPHRHDTYSIGYTIGGVQRFDYRGARADSTPGRVMVLHPDEVHNGEAGSDEGFHYRMLYVEPALIREALGSTATALPFVREAVLDDPKLLRAIHMAFADMEAPLATTALDDLMVLLADGLRANDRSLHRPNTSNLDMPALQRVRARLDEEFDRTVTSQELQQLSGLDRFTLARQFRRALGTSPYRYLMMRRLDRARGLITAGNRLADVAAATGFSDQAHMSRHFKASFGLSPGRWQKLHAPQTAH